MKYVLYIYIFHFFYIHINIYISYFEKYLKYNNKYLKIKNQIGSSNFVETNNKCTDGEYIEYKSGEDFDFLY